MIVGLPNVDEDVHRAATNHSLFAGLIGGQRETMESGFAVAHCFAGFGPDFGFNTTTTHGAGGLAILEEQHLRSATLRSCAPCVRHRGDHNSLSPAVCPVDQVVEFVLSNGSHKMAQTSVCDYSFSGEHRLKSVPLPVRCRRRTRLRLYRIS